MNRIIFLGTGAAVTSSNHENAHLLVQAGEQLVLVDCPANPIPRARQLGIQLADTLSALILTHFHADHVSGLALAMQTAWLLGRRNELTIYGSPYTIRRAKNLLALFEPESWPNMFPIRFNQVADREAQPVLESPDLKVFSSPSQHLIPSIALRFEFIKVGKSAAYSSDTEPSEAVRRLAQNVDVLMHEAAGASKGHSSASQAARIARDAGAKTLYLIHYQNWEHDPLPLLDEAGAIFPGSVRLSQDKMEIRFDEDR